MARLVERITKLEKAAGTGIMTPEQMAIAATALLTKLEAMPGPRIEPTDESKASLLALLKGYCQ